MKYSMVKMLQLNIRNYFYNSVCPKSVQYNNKLDGRLKLNQNQQAFWLSLSCKSAVICIMKRNFHLASFKLRTHLFSHSIPYPATLLSFTVIAIKQWTAFVSPYKGRSCSPAAMIQLSPPQKCEYSAHCCPPM